MPASPTGRVVVVGAGVAGVTAVETLRSRGYDGPLTLIDADRTPPYDRPPLSKSALRTGSPVELRPADLWTRLDLDLRLWVRATGLDLDRRVLATSDGALGYGRLLLTTGGIARWPRSLQRLPGALTLRTAADAADLHARLAPGARLVIVGAGLIGCEVAATARGLGAEVTLVDPLPRPLAAAVGAEAAQLLVDRHLAEGVRLRAGTAVTALVGGAAVEGVQLDDGTVLPADVVLVAVGGAAASAWLQGSGLALADPAPHAGVHCDPTLRAADGVYLAGDLAVVEGHGRSEHWMAAVEQAEVAAANLVDPPGSAWEPSPYFWTDQYDAKVQGVGVAPPDEPPALIDSSPDGRRQLRVWADADGRALSAVTVNWPARAMRWREQVRTGALVEPATVTAG